MAVRRRLIFWLIKAYITRWGKLIILYFLVGLGVFFLFLFTFSFLFPKFSIARREIVGVVGSYTVDTVPDSILREVSRGLTKVSDDGIAKPDLASSWGIEDGGKRYVFRIRSDAYFSDGSRVTSRSLPLAFTDVKVQKPDSQTIIFQLKDPYAPFLVTLSRPVIKKGFIGTGDYIVKDVKVNGNFIETFTIASLKETTKVKTYVFYPSADALKIAFALGEVTEARGLPDVQFRNTSFTHFPNASIDRHIEYHKLVTLFYNNADKYLSDKKLRDSLSYALPDMFENGQRAYSPFSPQSWAFTPENQYLQDIDHAKLLLQAAGYTESASMPELTISTSSDYESQAKDISKIWRLIGIKTKLRVTNTVPSSFQIYLGTFQVPKDPDQYTLWHSDAENNITNYKNLRIDKLLEDGRRTVDQEKRIKIYANFQKYLLDDEPASFLYFPYSYTVKRK